MHEVLQCSVHPQRFSLRRNKPAAKRRKKSGTQCRAERKSREMARPAAMHHSILQFCTARLVLSKLGNGQGHNHRRLIKERGGGVIGPKPPAQMQFSPRISAT